MVQAITVPRTGGATELTFAEIQPPALNPGEVRAAVRFAGVNFWDIMQRRGVVPLGPGSVPGVEGVGVITEVASDVSHERLGRRVAWSKVPGSYASEVTGPDWSFVDVPDSLEDRVAARLLMQGVTAQYLSESAWPLAAGESALVMAAAGGVGTLLTQFLTARGVRVIGVVSREEKKQMSLDAGAGDVIVDSDRFVEDVLSFAPDKVGAVFDANGSEAALRGLDVLRRRGALVLYGTASGAIPELDLNRLGNGSLYVTRAGGSNYAATPQEWRGRADDVLGRAVAGTLRAVDGGIWPLADAIEAHRHLESRASTGKLLLSIN